MAGVGALIPRKKKKIVNILTVFDKEIWIFLIVLTMILLYLLKIFKKYRLEESTASFKMLLLMSLMMSLVFDNIFQSTIASNLTKIRYSDDMRTLEDLEATKLEIFSYARPYSLISKFQKNSKKIQVLQKFDLFEVIKKAEGDKIFMLPRLVTSEFLRVARDGESVYRMIDEIIVPGPKIYFFRKNSPYLKEVENIMLYLQQAGLVNKIFYSKSHYTQNEHSYRDFLTMKHLRSAFSAFFFYLKSFRGSPTRREDEDDAKKGIEVEELKRYSIKWKSRQKKNHFDTGLADFTDNQCDYLLNEFVKSLEGPKIINTNSRAGEYFFFLPDLDAIEQVIERWQKQSRTYFVICNEVQNITTLDEVFAAIWKKKILNYVIAYPTIDKLEVVTFNPFTNEILNSDFEFFPNKLEDVRGYQIRVAMFDNFPTMKKVGGNWSGKDHDYLRLVEFAMNATFTIVETPKSKQFDGIRRALVEDRADFSFMGLFQGSDFEDLDYFYPHIMDGAVVMLPTTKQTIVDVLSVFGAEIWVCSGLLVIFLGFLISFVRKYPLSFKLLLLLFLTVPSVFSNIFQSGISSILTKTQYNQDIDTIQALRASKLPLLTFARFHKIITQIYDFSQQIRVCDKRTMYEMIAKRDENKGYILPYIVTLEFVKTSTAYRIMKEFLIPGQRIYLFQSNSPYLDEVGHIFLRLREADWMQEEHSEPKLHDWIIKPKKKLVQCERPPKAALKNKAKLTGPGPITWTVSDISKAGCLLTQPPLKTNFEDEQEMRRVYTLIYNVFRHKNVLSQALNDIGFFQIYPELESTISHIWLLFYDLYHRGFKKRETAVVATAKRLFKESKLTKAENSLWEYRTKLAAAVARLRIQHNALSLSDLLPSHLKDDKVPGYGIISPVTCWVNLKKVKNTEELRREIEKEFDLKPIQESENLGPGNYRWDKHCPHIMAFHGSMRTALARSDFVKSYKLVVQDKSFCLGPATFVKHVTALELSGSVIQTHVNSPRTTAYLATILSQNDKIKKLMAFSAGQRKIEYEDYLNQLGMTNVLIFSDRLIDVSPDANYMEEVVAVFATPPNSYSAVNDPIDLVCSRGGDLSMLEILTEAEESEEGKERAYRILEEQRKTLRFAMSRPQIQFVLYETHSGIDAENKGMVQRTVQEVNKIAKLHHATLQGKLIVPVFPEPPLTESLKEINNNEKLPLEDKKSETSIVTVETVKLSMDSDDKLFENIIVPETDIFDVPDLPHLCPSENSCINYVKEGCYLALLQRKQVIRLDNKYMIQMAENRGLFGRNSSSSTRTKGSKGPRKKQDKPPTPPPKNRRRIKDTEMARIAAPTHTFLRHTKDVCDVEKCPRCKCDQKEETKPAVYKQWWSETTRHIMALRSNLIKNKVITAKKNKEINAKSVVEAFIYGNTKVDEIVAKSRGADNSNIPVFPKLRLPREKQVEKVQLQLPITM
ncbi:methyltransferase NSUN7, partial [Asbolus verrucosus]